jgi:hypothetical protein
MEKKNLSFIHFFFDKLFFTMQFDGYSNSSKGYTRKYGGFSSIDEDKFSCGNQEQDGNSSFRYQNEACDFKKYVNPGSSSRQYGTSGNYPTSYGTPGGVYSPVNSPINSETPTRSSRNCEIFTSSSRNYETSGKYSYNNQQENGSNGSRQSILVENVNLGFSNYKFINTKYEPPRMFEDVNDQFDNFLVQCDRFAFINNITDISVPLADIDEQIRHFSILRDKFVAIKEQAERGKVKCTNTAEENYVKERVYLLAQQVYAKILTTNDNTKCKKRKKYDKKKKQRKNRKIGLFRY